MNDATKSFTAGAVEIEDRKYDSDRAEDLVLNISDEWNEKDSGIFLRLNPGHKLKSGKVGEIVWTLQDAE